MMDTLELNQNLIRLGLTKEEVDIILAITPKSGTNVSEISKNTGIPRSSVYRFIDNLVDKGLVKKTLSSQGNIMMLGNLKTFQQQLTEQKAQIQKQEEVLDNVLDSLTLLTKSASQSPRVNYYEGKQGIRQLIWNTLSSKSVIKCYTNAIRKDIVGGNWMTDYCLEFCRRDLKEYVIGDKEYANDSYQKFGGRKNYYLPVAQYFQRSDERILKLPFLKIKGEIYIYNQVFAFYTWEGNKLIGSEIESNFISQTQSTIFDVLWSLTKKEDNIDKFILGQRYGRQVA
jgi:sugar-specific transcriptional regulator TrmB